MPKDDLTSSINQTSMMAISSFNNRPLTVLDGFNTRCIGKLHLLHILSLLFVMFVSGRGDGLSDLDCTTTLDFDGDSYKANINSCGSKYGIYNTSHDFEFGSEMIWEEADHIYALPKPAKNQAKTFQGWRIFQCPKEKPNVEYRSPKSGTLQPGFTICTYPYNGSVPRALHYSAQDKVLNLPSSRYNVKRIRRLESRHTFNLISMMVRTDEYRPAKILHIMAFQRRPDAATTTKIPKDWIPVAFERFELYGHDDELDLRPVAGKEGTAHYERFLEFPEDKWKGIDMLVFEARMALRYSKHECLGCGTLVRMGGVGSFYMDDIVTVRNSTGKPEGMYHSDDAYCDGNS